MANGAETNSGQLEIKKYSNRRFYDTTRSCHVTQSDLHDLILAGYDLKITDSKSGEDITNAILTQILLEREAGKLDIFPANILHQMIRTQQQFLGNVMEQFFRQVMEAQRTSQERWNSFLRNTFGGMSLPMTNPMEWARPFWNAFRSESPAQSNPPPSTVLPNKDQELQALREQVAELLKRVESLSAQK